MAGKESPILEVIVCSVEDAIAAEQGGANRLEVVRDLDRGGMTPELSLVRDIRRAVSLPLRVIVRENDDFAFPGDKVFNRLRVAATELQQIGVDGLVIGFLRDGNVDIEATLTLLDAVPQLNATFHRAFDETDAPLNAISELKKCGQIDRILTSGGRGGLSDRAARLELHRQRALSEITLIAGGGLDEAAVRFLRARTGICEFHTGRAVRSPQDASGAVKAALVQRMCMLMSDENDREPRISSTAASKKTFKV